jgi:hypothetical protein
MARSLDLAFGHSGTEKHGYVQERSRKEVICRKSILRLGMLFSKERIRKERRGWKETLHFGRGETHLVLFRSRGFWIAIDVLYLYTVGKGDRWKYLRGVALSSNLSGMIDRE